MALLVAGHELAGEITMRFDTVVEERQGGVGGNVTPGWSPDRR